MASHISYVGSASRPIEQNTTSLPIQTRPSNLYLSEIELPSESSDDPDDMIVSEIQDEDAHSLMEPSLSQAATRLKSPKTPAIEKAAAMEQLEGGGFFDSEVETPPAVDQNQKGTLVEGIYEPPTSPEDLGEQDQDKAKSSSGKVDLHLGKLPSPDLETPTMPTPWHAGPKIIEAGSNSSSLAGVFGASGSRSRSGSTDGFKKYLPNLPSMPSMAQVGNLFGTSTSQKPDSGNSLPPTDSRYTRFARSTSMSFSSSSPPKKPLPHPHTYAPTVSARPQGLPRQGSIQPQRPKTVRRSTSDDSLLYHSLSRASSLGDDSRFEGQHEQVNSRVKAIRDSLQDRSSFRMPQLPSMPSMPSMPRVSSFSFNMSFMNANSVPARWRSDTDTEPDILPGTTAKKRPVSTPHPAIAPGMVGAAVSRPEAAIDTAKAATETSHQTALDRAMEHLTGDIVIMGGYRGSVLRSTKTNRQVWVPVKVGLNIRKVDLEVGLGPEDEERMEESIYASGMLQNIGPVDISKRLFKRLCECENARNGKLRVWDYGYDWRLSPHLLSRRLTKFLEHLPSNQPSKDGSIRSNRGALVIAHSLGGLITRHVVNHRPELFSGVVYAGVPQACVNILGPLRNGDAVLLSSRVLTAQVNFTLRTSFVLLPEDGGCFIDLNTKEKYPVDFFNLDDWIKYRWSPCTDPPLPPRNQQSSGLGSILNMSNSLLSLPIPGKKSVSGSSTPTSPGFSPTRTPQHKTESHSPPTKTTRAADVLQDLGGGNDRTLAPHMGSNSNPVSKGQSTSQSVSTAVSIPRPKAIEYLKRTLAETLKFKQELHFKPELASSNRYPPLALIYGKSIPTVYGAKVDGREGIPCSDSYDNLAFASGDGVCLAREAMLPPGYKAVYGGRISSDRGHVTLLGDLSAVGRAIEAVSKGRAKGIGLGMSDV